MKAKKYLLLLGVLVFLFVILTACDAFVSSKAPSTGNTDASDYSENTDPIGNTDATDHFENTVDTGNTVVEPSLTAKDCFTFIRYGNQTFAKNLDIDPSALENNCLYVHDKRTGENYLIAEVNVHCFGASNAYIYYISLDGTEIIRCDYAGTNKTPVYHSNKKITWVDYCEGKTDQLLIVEDRKVLSLLDLADGSKDIVMRHFCINEAFYREEVSFYTGQFHRKVEIQDVVLWSGKHIESGDSASYLFDMNTNVLFAFTGSDTAEAVHLQTPWLIDRPMTPHRYKIINSISTLSYWAPQKFDETLFKEGCLNVLDTYYDVLFTLSDTEISGCTFHHDYIYYSNGNEIIRCNYVGADKTVVYQTDHDVTALSYIRHEDKLLIVEDNQRAILFDLVTKSSELLMEQKFIHSRLLYYYPNSLEFTQENYPSYLEFTQEEKGRLVTWFGHTFSDDEEPGRNYKDYVYFVDTGELIYGPDY